MIIKNEIPILEYDNFSIEVIKPNHGCEELKLPEKCVFAFLGDCVDEFAMNSNAIIAEEFENCCRTTNIKGKEDVLSVLRLVHLRPYSFWTG